jgi:hypothetical protein
MRHVIACDNKRLRRSNYNTRKLRELENEGTRSRSRLRNFRQGERLE